MAKQNSQNKKLTVAIDKCHPNSYNSNKMSEIKFQALVNTIKANGQTHPIQVVEDDAGTYRIIGGEHKWRAMKLLKFTEVDILVRAFEDETEEKLSSLEDNLHGDSIPVREALILAEATKKYPIQVLERRLGESKAEINDKLLLVQSDEIIKKARESFETEHLVEIDFIVDMEPEENGKNFLKGITAAAKKLGAAVAKSEFRKAKGKETVMLVSFTVSNTQQEVIDLAINGIMKSEKVTKARALELMSADWIAGDTLSK